MCYREPVELDFHGVHVACLSGENGSGKSALLDAITWALWGKARVDRDRDLLALGAPEMEVSFGFILGEQEFRVTRRRGRGGTGPLLLEIQALDGDRWRSLTGDSVRQSQQVIDRLLRMDYDTFINSAFILQGRADEFTTKTPAQRKHVLAEILNLGDYDRYEEIARQAMRERERRLQDIDATLGDVGRQLEDLPRRREEVDSLSRELLLLADAADQHREQLKLIQSQLHTLEVATVQRDALRHRIRGLNDEIAKIETDQHDLRLRIERHQSVLERRSEIEALHQELLELRERSEQLTAWLAEQHVLMERRRCLDQQIQAANQAVQSQVHSLDGQIGARDRIIGEKPQYAAQLAAIKAEAAGLAGLGDELARLRREQGEQETERGMLQAENAQLRREMEDLKARMDQITDGAASCPVCRRGLGPDERRRLEDSYRQEGTSLADRFRANQARMKDLSSMAGRLVERLQELEQRRKLLEFHNQRRSALEERLRAIATAEQEVAELVQRRDELARSLRDGEPAAAFLRELTEVEQALKAVAALGQEHRAVRLRIAELMPVEEDRWRLDQADAALEGDERQRARLLESLELRRADLAEAREQEARLSAELIQIEPLRGERDELQAKLDRVERQRSELQERFGAAQQRLNDCLRLQDQREDLAGERKRVAEQKTLYEELVLAFGKRGIQAMIIENIVPELQDEANAILDKMPCNAMRVEFRTQRQTVRGEGVIETLDIVISDEAGRRPYELYSGGEAFRVNFAIRVALSTLLARRAGTKLQTLVIDEGFGTQDARGLDGLIEAIHAIERDFQMVLVITHIAELKELFPTRIDVVRTPDGSRVRMN
jgi:exonuclease SbcC